MRLLVFSELLYPHGGGAELATWLYSKLLVEEGIKITIVTKQFPGEPPVDSFSNGVTIYRLPIDFMFGSRYYTLANVGVLASSFISNLIKQSDVVYVPCGWYSVIPVAKYHNKPVIVHLHNYAIACSTALMYDFVDHKVGSSFMKSYMLHEMVERRRGSASVVVSCTMNECIGKFYNRVGALGDALIFVSNAQRDLVLSAIPRLREKSYMIYNPISDLQLIKAEKSGIGYFGGKKFVKGYYVLIQALKSSHSSNMVQAYLTMTSKKHARTELDNGVTLNFLPKLPEVNLANLMKQLSIVVVPSLWPEPSPYSLIESMMRGKLVIASDIGGMPEILEGDTSGIKLTKPGNPEEIAKGLDFFLSLTLEEANEFGFKNRECILQKFDNDRTVYSFINVLEKLNTR